MEKPQNHRTVWVCRILYLQPPCHVQGHFPLEQVSQSPIQLGLECFQGWKELLWASLTTLTLKT